MSDILLKNKYTGNLPDAPEGHSRLMSNEKGALVLIDQDRKETALVGAVIDPLTGEVVQVIAVVTQAQYDALVTKDAKTLYIIKG